MHKTPIIAAIFWVITVTPGFGQSQPSPTRLNELFAALRLAQSDEWQVIEDEIWLLWGQSGSPSIDLLLERGKAALAGEENEAAIEHFTALIDHAPGFAEGWNSRATAYFNAGLLGPSLADIRQALALEPRHFGALAGLGVILEEMGFEKEALHAFHEVLRIHPNRDDVQEAIDRLEMAIGSFDA